VPYNPFLGEEEEEEYTPFQEEPAEPSLEEEALGTDYGPLGPPILPRHGPDDFFNFAKAVGRSFVNSGANLPTELWNSLTFLADPLDISGARQHRDPETGRPALEMDIFDAPARARDAAWEKFRAGAGDYPVLNFIAQGLGTMAGDVVNFLPLIGAASAAVGTARGIKLSNIARDTKTPGVAAAGEELYKSVARPVREGKKLAADEALENLPDDALYKMLGANTKESKGIVREARERLRAGFAGEKIPEQQTLFDIPEKPVIGEFTRSDLVGQAEQGIHNILKYHIRNSNIVKVESDLNKTTKWLLDKFGTFALAPPSVRASVAQTRGAVKWFDMETKLALMRLQEKLLPYAGDPGTWKALKDPLNRALMGDVEALTELPPVIKESVETLGDSLRKLQLEVLKSPHMPMKIKEKVQENLSKYFHRSYAAHDDPTYLKGLDTPAAQQKWDTAIESVLADNPRWTPAQARAYLEDLVNMHEGDFTEFLSASREMPGRPYKGIFKPRRIEDVAVRELLGEYKDPLVNYFKSATFLHADLQYQQMYRDIADDLLERGLASIGRKSGPFKHPLSGGRELVPFVDNIFVTKDIFHSLNTARDLGHWWATQLPKYLSFVNYPAKMNVTMFNTATQSRNIINMPAFMLMQGHRPLFGTGMAKGVEASYRYGLLRPKDLLTIDRTDPDIVADLAILAKENLLGQNVDFGDVKRFREPVSDFLHRRAASPHATVRGAAKAAQKVEEKLVNPVTQFYRSTDDGPRFGLLRAERARYQKAGFTEDEARNMAVEVVRESMTNYAEVPKAVRFVREFPVFGPFVSFPAEIARITKNTAFRAVQEIKSGDPRLVSIGYQRLAGMVGTTIVGPAALRTAGNLWSNATPKEHSAVRDFLPEFMENSEYIIWRKEADKGVYYVQDLSFLDPFNYMKKPVIALHRAIMRGDDPDDALAQFELEIVAPAAQMEIPMNAVMTAVEDIKEGEDPTGAILRALADIYLPAALDTQAKRMAEATGIVPELFPQQRSIYSDERSIARELAAVFGMRVIKVDVIQELRGKTRDYHQQFSGDFKDYRNARDTNAASARQTFMRAKALESWREANDWLLLKIERARAAGLNREQIYRGLRYTERGTKNAVLGDVAISALFAGQHPPIPKALFQ
jgi:hypothetical protein